MGRGTDRQNGWGDVQGEVGLLRAVVAHQSEVLIEGLSVVGDSVRHHGDGIDGDGGAATGICHEDVLEIVQGIGRSSGNRPTGGELVTQIGIPAGLHRQIQVVDQGGIGSHRAGGIRPGQADSQRLSRIDDAHRDLDDLPGCRKQLLLIPEHERRRRVDDIGQVNPPPSLADVGPVRGSHVDRAVDE